MGKNKKELKDYLKENIEDLKEEGRKGEISEVAKFFCCLPNYRFIRDRDIKESLEKFIETKIQEIKNEDSKQSAILKEVAFEKSRYDEIFGAISFVSLLGVLETKELTDLNKKITKEQGNINK